MKITIFGHVKNYHFLSMAVEEFVIPWADDSDVITGSRSAYIAGLPDNYVCLRS